MSFKKNVFGFVIFVGLVLIVQGCGGSSHQSLNSAGSDKYYLKNNIHAQVGPRDTKASYANWTDPGNGHIIILLLLWFVSCGFALETKAGKKLLHLKVLTNDFINVHIFSHCCEF